MDIQNIDSSVLNDARRMLERAARLLEQLNHADTATLAGERAARSKLSEAVANIHAALARIEE